MSSTATVKAALVTDLGGIAGVGDVLTEPRNLDFFVTGTVGGLYILSSSGATELESFSNSEGKTAQAFTLQLVVKSDSDPNSAMDTFLDLVRSAVESPTSAVKALNGGGVVGVEQATVDEWGPVESIENIQMGLYVREADVTVVYYYSRGSA